MQDKVIDMSFLEYIRAFMRQDPDIIFIGEWRKEKELTEAIVYASNTGHLVLTSLHSNSAALIPSLLINDYGLEKEDVANNSVGFINQVLIKRVCRECVEKRIITEEEVEKAVDILEFQEDKELVRDSITGKECLFVGIGCSNCTVLANNGSVISIGYTGRMATYEWVTVDQELRTQILTNVATNKINDVIRKKVKEGKAKRYLDTGITKLIEQNIDYDTFIGIINKI
jgi:type IV pilus assembly protein PilB